MPEVRDRNTFNVRMREADAFWNKQNKKTQQCFYKPIDTSNTEENKKLSQMFNYHYRQIETRIKQKETEYGESWTGDQEKSVYEEILAIATRRLTLVTLEPPSTYDINKVFETLNEQGSPLTTPDLVRNYIFGKVKSDEQEQVDHYESYWRPFETSLKVDIDDKALVDYFNRYGMIKYGAPTNRVFTELKSDWIDKKPEEIMKDLNHYVNAFRALKKGTKHAFPDLEDDEDNVFDPLEKTIERWRKCGPPNSMDTYTIQLLRHFQTGKCTEKQVKQCLSLLESMLVRRSFSSIEGTGLNALFKDLWNDEKGPEREYLAHKIKSSPHIKFPDDEEFRNAVVGEDTNFYGRKLATFVLRVYEEGKYGKTGLQMSSLPTPEKEHIIPKTWRDGWDYKITKEEHERWKNSWANIALLTKENNSKIQDNDWEKKRSFYKDHCVFPTVKELYEVEEMGLSFIEKRAEELSKWALSQWPGI